MSAGTGQNGLPPNQQMQPTGRRGTEFRAGRTFRWRGCGSNKFVWTRATWGLQLICISGQAARREPAKTEDLIERVCALTSDIRYVAVYLKGQLQPSQHPGLAQASASESDKYEELIVNPTLLTLTRQ